MVYLNNMIKLSALICLLSISAGCKFESGLPTIDGIFIVAGNSFQEVINENVLIETEPYLGDIKADNLATAKIFIGDTFEAQATTYETEPLGRRFIYETSSSCTDLPQGQNLIARYEMYNTEGISIQEASVTVNINSCD